MSARAIHEGAVDRAQNVLGRYAALHDRNYKEKPVEEGVHDLMVDLMHAMWQLGIEPADVIEKAAATYIEELRLLG